MAGQRGWTLSRGRYVGVEAGSAIRLPSGGAGGSERATLQAHSCLRALGHGSVCAVPFQEPGRGRGWGDSVPPWGPSSPPAPRSPNRRVAGCGPTALRCNPSPCHGSCGSTRPRQGSGSATLGCSANRGAAQRAWPQELKDDPLKWEPLNGPLERRRSDHVAPWVSDALLQRSRMIRRLKTPRPPPARPPGTAQRTARPTSPGPWPRGYRLG